VRVGDTIQLRSESGSLIVRIKQIELIKQHSGPCRVGLLLSSEINEAQIPPGAEIWGDRSK